MRGEVLKRQDKVLPVRCEFLSKGRTRMTSIEILCALLKITSDKVGSRLDRHHQTRNSFYARKESPGRRKEYQGKQ